MGAEHEDVEKSAELAHQLLLIIGSGEYTMSEVNEALAVTFATTMTAQVSRDCKDEKAIQEGVVARAAQIMNACCSLAFSDGFRARVFERFTTLPDRVKVGRA